MERIYAIVHRSRPEAYVGRTYLPLNERWAQHLNAAARGETKTLFEELRHAPSEWDILECEYSETASEADWIKRFEDDGYRLLNEVGGNRRPPKVRDTAKEHEVQQALLGASSRWEPVKIDPAAAALAREKERERVKAYVAAYVGDEPAPLTDAQQVLETLRAGKKWVA